MDFRPLFAISTLFLAGCLGGDSDVAPTTSPAPHMPPMTVLPAQTVNACPGPPPGPDPAYQTAQKTAKFEVKQGYDEIIIAFHTSGEGQGGAEIRWIEEENKVIWSRPTNERISSAPAACGGHAHTGDGVTKQVEPGNYTVKIQYLGSVAIHMEVTARSSKVMETGVNHTHSAR